MNKYKIGDLFQVKWVNSFYYIKEIHEPVPKEYIYYCIYINNINISYIEIWESSLNNMDLINKKSGKPLFNILRTIISKFLKDLNCLLIQLWRISK